MADLRTEFCGIKSPNPFWLASAPPTDKEFNVVRAFKAGWGGVVWKTLGEDPPIVNVSSRYGALHYNDDKQVKRDWPDRAVVVSLMVPCDEHAWVKILKLVDETGADGVELNFGCPHGMSERGMGSAVGQVPEYVEMVARWCKTHTRMPVLVKLTPNVTSIMGPARAAKAGGADGVSLINTINSITSIDLDVMAPTPTVDGKGTHGGYCGPAVKPIALHMVAEIARDASTRGMPISAIGGIATWRDAAEFIALNAGTVQVCTAAMHYGFKIIDDMIDGLANWMDEKGYARIDDFRGKAVANVTDWQFLNMNFKTIAHIDQDLCITCGLCHIACEDTSHQSIAAERVDGRRRYRIIDEECVGCNLCQHVCPVPNCITMVPVETGKPYLNWTQHPNNPMREAAE